MTKTWASLPALRAPIQQVQRSRNPPGKDGNGSWANPFGRSQCQTIPLPEESGAKSACAKGGGCRSVPLHSRRGTSSPVQQLCAGSDSGTQPAPPQRAALTGQGHRHKHHPPPRCPGNLFDGSPRSGLVKPKPPSANRACRLREQSLPGAASRSWEREEKPLGVTAPLGMPGGRIPPLTPTPSSVMSWLSSPMP